MGIALFMRFAVEVEDVDMDVLMAYLIVEVALISDSTSQQANLST